MTYQVIAFDLDGTLLNGQGEILESSRKAIQQAREKGLKIVLVTGRHHTAVKPYYHQMALDTPIICCNGTYIYYPQTDEVKSANPLSMEQCHKVIAIADKYQTHLLMYSRDAMNYTRLNPHMEKFQQWVMSCPEAVRPNVRKIDNFNALIDNPAENIWKFVISSPDRRAMESAVEELPVSEFSCEWSWIDRVDVANNGNSKGGRLLELLKQWNVDLQNVIAFGDNHNDTSMLKSVGLGVAMGNADDAVKSQAKRVIGSNNDDSIAQFIRTII
ncbi:pyridoxal phosphatase [Bisgaard Taxon 10/6]|uniref:pyridoxal phosphatase n=1 Tax=Exercitatus varius TaxID=67857 RepID=UPI00294A9C2E|nr:pyridoxal phosphatase [Exercitatus varius]MDG2960291.1 pyridoxal phosphatase [Exercitatus varius]